MNMKKSQPLSDEELEVFEASRDLYAELKQAASEIQAGLGRVVYSPLIAVRKNSGFSQAEFAELLGVSPAILEDWEQQRAEPTEAALFLIAIARDNPQALLEATKTRTEVPQK